jgi:hypothetical protein
VRIVREGGKERRRTSNETVQAHDRELAQRAIATDDARLQ